MSQEKYDAYCERSAADNTWKEGYWYHPSGTMMRVRRCDWVSDGLYGEVYWIGVDEDGTITPLGSDEDAKQNWTFVGRGKPRVGTVSSK